MTTAILALSHPRQLARVAEKSPGVTCTDLANRECRRLGLDPPSSPILTGNFQRNRRWDPTVHVQGTLARARAAVREPLLPGPGWLHRGALLVQCAADGARVLGVWSGVGVESAACWAWDGSCVWPMSLTYVDAEGESQEILLSEVEDRCEDGTLVESTQVRGRWCAASILFPWFR